MNEHLKTLSLLLTAYLPKVAAAGIVFFAGRWLANWVARIVARLLETNGVEPTLVKFLRPVIFNALLIVVLISSLRQLGVDTSSFLTVIGAAGLAVGLALKDSLSHLSAGAMLVLFRPFKIGDFITAAGVSGEVREISLFNTELATVDNQKIIVPNSSIVNGIITNACAHPLRRVDLTIGVGYQDDLRRAKEVLATVVEAETLALKEPAPAILVVELAESSVNLACRVWVKTEDYLRARSSLIEGIKTALDQAGISIPFPQQEVRVFLDREPSR